MNQWEEAGEKVGKNSNLADRQNFRCWRKSWWVGRDIDGCSMDVPRMFQCSSVYLLNLQDLKFLASVFASYIWPDLCLKFCLQERLWGSKSQFQRPRTRTWLNMPSGRSLRYVIAYIAAHARISSCFWPKVYTVWMPGAVHMYKLYPQNVCFKVIWVCDLGHLGTYGQTQTSVWPQL